VWPLKYDWVMPNSPTPMPLDMALLGVVAVDAPAAIPALPATTIATEAASIRARVVIFLIVVLPFSLDRCDRVTYLFGATRPNG